MQCMNGILILTPEEKEALEADIGPITSYNVEDVRLQLVNAVEKREAEGHHVWAKITRRMLERVSAFAGSNA